MAKMFIVWKAMEKFKDVNFRGIVFFAVVSDAPFSNHMEDLWIFAYKGWNDTIVYAWALKVVCWRQND